jgi:hypothetical protein
MECLENIIGVTRDDCPCLVGTDPVEIEKYKLSTSGLYIDSLEGGLHLSAVKSLDACKTFSQMAFKAIADATKRTSDDVVMMLNSKYSKGKDNYIGAIGNRNHVRLLGETKPYVGIKIPVMADSDGTLKIKKMELVLNQSGPFEILIIKAYKGAEYGETLHNLPVTTVAGTLTNIPLPDNKPIELPLAENGIPLHYYVVYDRGTAQPMDTKIGCGCGSVEKILHQYFNPTGYVFDDLAALNLGYTDGWSHGLILDVEARCDSFQFVCKEYDRNDAVAVVLSHAIMYKTGQFLIEAVMKSNEITRYTMMNREYLWGKRANFGAEYDSRMSYIEKVIDPVTTDCFVCRKDTATSLQYRGIVATGPRHVHRMR